MNTLSKDTAKTEVLKVFRQHPKGKRLTTRQIREQMLSNPPLLFLESVLGELCTKQNGNDPELLSFSHGRRPTEYELGQS